MENKLRSNLVQTVTEWTAPLNFSGKRLDSALAESGIGLSRAQAQKLIEEGLIRMKGHNSTLKASQKLKGGELLSISVPAPSKLDLEPVDLSLDIVYEDSQLAVINKPAGLSVHPSDTESGPTLVHGLLYQLKSLSSVGGVERPGIVHRIDKGTSGLLVTTKTDRAHASLSQQFKVHSVQRLYRALVFGDLRTKKGSSGRVETFFGRHPVHRKKMTGKLTEGRVAITHWKVLESFSAGLTLVECRLETGRTHQIRVHMAELGFPLVGDPLYGQNAKLAETVLKKHHDARKLCTALNHQLLHAATLGFTHPSTKRHASFSAELPEDFQAILLSLRDTDSGLK